MHAQAPQHDTHHFGPDKGGGGLEGLVPDTFVAGARLFGPGKLLIPGVRALLAGIADDLATMLAPLQARGVRQSQLSTSLLSPVLRLMTSFIWSPAVIPLGARNSIVFSSSSAHALFF
jgi:hypothetical protein